MFKFSRSGLLVLSIGSVFIMSLFSVVSAPRTVFAALVCDPATELTVNGSFESPVVTHPDLWDIYPSGTAGLGWNATWLTSNAGTFGAETLPTTAYLEFQRNGHNTWGIPFDGQQYAELDTDWKGPNFPAMSYPSSIDLFQNINTIPGATYTLKFATSPRPDDSDLSDNSAKVSWNGGLIDTIAPSSVNPLITTWTSHSYTLVATASTTRIDFVDGGHANAIGIFVDGVSLKCASLPVIGGGGGVGTTTVATSSTPVASSTLTVIVTTVNANGGTSTPANFTVTTNAAGVSTTTATSSAVSLTFAGNASGTVLTLIPGTYSVSVTTPSGYTKSLSVDCAGTILGGTSKTCTITTTDPVPAPAPVVSGGGGGGSGGGPITFTSGGGGISTPPVVSGSGPVATSTASTTSSGGGGGVVSTTTPSYGVGGGGGIITPIGQVLGASTSTVPGMPYTGNGDSSDNLIILTLVGMIALVSSLTLVRRLA